MATITTSDLDSNGIQRVLHDHILDVRYVDVSKSRFANPDSGYTGYAASGYWYTAGQLDPAILPFKASWAVEGEGDPTMFRGTQDSFPDRIFVITTPSEVVLIDADNLDVWMRFVPLLVAVAGYGALLGDSNTSLESADFREGYLVVATSDGLRIADFRRDAGYVLGRAASSRSKDRGDGAPYVGLSRRNIDLYLSYQPILGNSRVADNSCLHVELSSESSTVLAAVGHASGLTGVTLSSAVVDIPVAKIHEFVLDHPGTPWAAVDDNDGDGTTPYIVSSTVWEDVGVRAGDTVYLAALHTVLEVNDSVLTLYPEVAVGAAGPGYEVRRLVPSLKVSGGALYFANGGQQVTRVPTTDWYDPPGSGDQIDAFTVARTVLTHSSSLEIYDIEVNGTAVYLGTDIGVFLVIEDDFVPQRAAEYRYSGGGTGVAATHEILEGGSDCRALVIDPETGHLLVAVVDDYATESTITEIDLSINQAFQYIGDLPPVYALTAYRNPAGPPDTEVG